jgi:GAF domain-containing protein
MYLNKCLTNGCAGKLDPNEKEANYITIIENLTKTFDSTEFIDPTEIYMTVVGELSNIPYYDWVGIYILDSDKQELNLDNYIGLETEHIRIPVGQGVCGSAVAERTDKVIHDIREETNYLACSIGTRSEIVVLIEDNEIIIGQIDVDSDQVGAFDSVDQKFLKQISEMIVNQLKILK